MSLASAAITDMLRQFVQGITDEVDDNSLDVDALTMQLSDEIDDAILDALPVQSLQLLAEMEKDESISADSYDKLLQGSGIDRDEVVTQAMKKFRDNMLNRKEA